MIPQVPSTKPTILTTPQRVAIIAGAALAAFAYVFWLRRLHAYLASDITSVWLGARAWLHGENPYAAVVASGIWRYPLVYPFTAVLVLTPLALLPSWAADAVFVAVSAGLLAWVVTRTGELHPAALALVSAPLLQMLQYGQWSALLTAAALIPWAGWLLVCKPTIGLALFAAYPRRATAIGCALLLVVATLIWPGWIGEWRHAVRFLPNPIAPVTRPGGILILLALFAWREPAARLLVALACIPHTTLAYETLPLFLVARTWPEAWIVWAGTALATIAHASGGPYPSQYAWVAAAGDWLVWTVYLPCTALLVRRATRRAGSRESNRVEPAAR